MGLKAGLYIRISEASNFSESYQSTQLKNFCQKRNMEAAYQESDSNPVGSPRPGREKLISLAKKNKIDLILVWSLERWARSLPDLITSLSQLNKWGIGFISITEGIDLSTPHGSLLSSFLSLLNTVERDLFSEKIKTGIIQSRRQGKKHGRPRTITPLKTEIIDLDNQGIPKSEIANRLNISRTSVRRILSD